MKIRTFNAEFKAKIVLEVLRGEKELNVIAAKNEIAPNQIRNWKAEFGNKIYPYLLRNAVITRPNQAWSIDITYINCIMDLSI